MKKTIILALAISLIASYGYAAQTSESTNFTLGTTAGETTTVGLSNEVTAMYENGGDTSPQWYAIATTHKGGDKIFATAQDITNIYSQGKTPGDVPSTWTGMPTGSGDSNVWSGDLWKAL